MSSRAFRFQAWLQEREGRSFALPENSGRDNPDLVHGSRAARRAVIQEARVRDALYGNRRTIEVAPVNPPSGSVR